MKSPVDYVLLALTTCRGQVAIVQPLFVAVELVNGGYITFFII